jgi:hypothetical protein
MGSGWGRKHPRKKAATNKIKPTRTKPTRTKAAQRVPKTCRGALVSANGKNFLCDKDNKK